MNVLILNSTIQIDGLGVPCLRLKPAWKLHVCTRTCRLITRFSVRINWAPRETETETRGGEEATAQRNSL